MAEKPEEKKPAERKGRRSMHDHPSSKKAAEESRGERGAKDDGQPAGETKGDMAEPGQRVLEADAEIQGRHEREHAERERRHENERRDMHGRHREKHRTMAERHKAERMAVKTVEDKLRTHRRHDEERRAMHHEHHKEMGDMHRRHEDEAMRMHERHEKELIDKLAEMHKPGTEAGNLAAAA